MSNENIPVPVETELDALFGQYTAANQAPGLVYGLAGPEGLVHSAGFGVANDAGLMPDENTVFPIASMSKSFIACAALLARDRGALSLEDPITKWIPEFSATGTIEDPCQPPTVRMLFSMSGGLTEDNSWVDPFIDATEQDLLAQVSRGLRYSHVPGTVYEYSNLGYTLAGLAVARAVGQPIERFVEDEVLAPLRLTSTCFDNIASADIVRATGYSLDPNGQWVPFPHVASGAFAAAGGLMSSVRDLATWLTWLGSAFRTPSSRDVGLLSRSSRRELQRIHMIETPSITTHPDGGLHFGVSGYGLGLRISMDLHRGTVVSHAGGLPGFILFMCWHPDSGNGIVVLTNSHRGEPAALATEALGRVLARNNTAAETIVLWPETVEMRKSAEQLIRNWDDALADQVFAENIDFDRPLKERRAEIDRLVSEIGPLGDPTPVTDVVSAATSADVTWSIPGQRGELLCMIHLTPVSPARIQEFVVQAIPAGRPRSARPIDISPRRPEHSEAFLGQMSNVRIRLPD
jgi:CubicO group peptidase (beta-lactamase class C family)